MTQGILQALTSAIGSADNDIGGVTYTRLTAPIATGASLVATLAWDGTLVVATTDTSELVEGDWIRLDINGRYFQIVGIIPNVQCEIQNPVGYPIPTGSTYSSKAVQTFPVESALDWQDSGKFAIDGIVYHYVAKTLTSFLGVFHIFGGDLAPGPYKQHHAESPVLDLNQNRTGLDQVRRALLVDYAEGSDLNALGRNLGVLRLPFLASDDRFRAIIKALAYNPKGTMYGLELALNGLVGEGNYELYEDVIRYPNQVFIRLVGAAATDTRSEGKAFLSGPEYQVPVAANQIDVDNAVISRGTLHGIFWKPEDLTTDTRTAYPTAQFVREYPAASLTQAWRYYGGTEGVQVKLQNGGVQFDLPAPDARYQRQLRVTDDATIEVEIVARSVQTGASETWPQTVLSIADGSREVALSFRFLGGTGLELGLTKMSGSFWTPTVSTTLTTNRWYTLKLVKRSRIRWEAWVDGKLVLTSVYGVDDLASTERWATLGVRNGVTTCDLVVKQIQICSRDSTDVSSLYGRTGSIVSVNQIDIGSADFVVGDVGSPFLISGSAAVNPSGGNNNGRWVIQSVDSGSQVSLDGSTAVGAIVHSTNPTRVVVSATGPQIQYPDDLGKTLTISGSTLGNNGSWPIARILDPTSLVDLASWSTVIPVKSTVCELTGPSFVPEPGLTWQLSPAFVAESALRYDMAGAASIVSQTITTRRNLPAFSDANFQRVFAAVYSQLLSSQALPGANTANVIIQEIPDLLFSYYPFYLADPLAFIRLYLDDVTAAGVIPDYLIV